MNTIFSFFRKLFSADRSTARLTAEQAWLEAYLAQSADIYELENRMRALELRPTYSTLYPAGLVG